MNKDKKPSRETQFMRTMIITGLVGLGVMVFATLYMFKLFGGEKTGAKVLDDPLISLGQDSVVEEPAGQKMRALIYDLGFANKNIKAWDLDQNKLTKFYIKDKTQLEDQYGKLMSRQEIQVGEIVDIIYEDKTKTILRLTKSPNAWTKSALVGTEINTDDKTIKINNTRYDYKDSLLVLDENFKAMDLSEINNLDTLTIKGIGDTIWSIRVEEAAGYLKLLNLKTREGSIEIGNKQRFLLSEIEEHLALPAGNHKVVVRMEGYEPFADQVTISLNQVEEIDLGQVKEIMSELRVKVINTSTDYEVEIKDKTYKKGDLIKIKPGQYRIKVRAADFKTAEMDIELKQGPQNLNIRLEKEEEPEEQEEGGQQTQAGSQKTDKPKTSQDKTSSDRVNQNEEPPVEEEIKTVQIIIETDPTGAEVFVAGVSKGTTPALTGLKPGEYSITIEKEGYSPLYSTIIIDASNAQKGFLYTLQEE